MVDIAYIFPGQGAQFVGMGKDLYDEFPVAKELFKKAGGILGFDLSKICFDGPADVLQKTSICQPAILTTSVICLEVLKSLHKDKFNPKFSLGLSLGEYTALIGAGSLSFEDAVRLVHKRGLFMDEAAAANPGKMASIIGLEQNAVDEICRESGAQIANLNCPGQFVISAGNEAMVKAQALAEAKGAKRFILLDVSGPFHSSLMKPASQKLEVVLRDIKIEAPKIKFIANVTANIENVPQRIKQNLIIQVANTTRFEASIRLAASEGIAAFLEVGPGNILQGLLRKIDSNLKVLSLGNCASIKEFAL